jgi:iron complex outermembrane receptor protein
VIVSIAIAFLIAAGADSAAVRPAPRDTVVVLPEVRVDRERPLSDARRRMPTAFVSEIPTGAAGRALESLADVLGEVAGVRVTQYGGLGAFSTVSLRGAPPGQVAVFLDGAPLTSAARGVVNLADLPLTAIERIEVWRGLAPPGLGVAAPGGAINLITRVVPEAGEVRVVRGAFDTWEARASGGGSRGSLSALLHAGLQRSAGDFTYPDDNGTPYNPADDSMSTRVNHRLDAANATAALTWRAPEAAVVTGRGEVFHKAQGVPGLGAVPAWRTHLELLRTRGQIEAARPGAGPVPHARLRAGLEGERTRFRDPDAELGLGRHDTDDRFAGHEAALELEWPRVVAPLAFSVGGSLRGERSRLSNRADGFADPPPSTRATRGAHAALQLRPLGERLIVHAGWRWDRLDDRRRWNDVGGGARAAATARTLTSPQLGVRARVAAGLELRANWARAERAPDFLELFGNQGSVLGNPELAAERGENRDAGLAWAGTLAGIGARFEAAAFASEATNLIVYVRHSQSSARAENVARARIRGGEGTVTLRRGALGATLALTAMTSRDQGPVPYWNGRDLPQHPRWQGHGRLDWTRGALRVTADVQAIGDNALDRANLQWVPARTLLGAAMSWRVTARARITVEGRNLGDDHVSDVGGFPLPGRALFVSCDARLGGTHP